MTQKFNILAIDDESFNLLLLQSCLGKENCTLVCCQDPLAAIGEFKKQDFDIVLLDIMLGAIDGFEVRKLIRQYNAKVPIIFLTSLLDDINSSLLGRIADDAYSYYLNKSFNKKTLLEKISHAVNVYREENEMSKFYRMVESELSLAWEVQRVMLPAWSNRDNALVHSCFYEPGFKVSGDIFELVNISKNKKLVFLGDISGHGVQAALYMSALQSFLKTIHTERNNISLTPHMILNYINFFYSEELNGQNYITCLVGIFDLENNTFSFQCAGHPGPICCLPDEGKVFQIEPPGKGSIPIGWRKDIIYDEKDSVEFKFPDNAIFMAYTDGLVDLCNDADEQIGLEKIIQLLGPLSKESDIIAMPFRLRNAIEQIGYTKKQDDVTIFMMQKDVAANNVYHKVILPVSIQEIGREVLVMSNFVFRRYDSQDIATRVELLLSEFLNNIVAHGFSGRKSIRVGIAVTIRCETDRVVISVFDREPRWEIDNEETAGDKLDRLNDEKAFSGRGLPIIRRIANSIRRKFYNGLNETEFVIPLTPDKEKN